MPDILTIGWNILRNNDAIMINIDNKCLKSPLMPKWLFEHWTWSSASMSSESNLKLNFFYVKLSTSGLWSCTSALHQIGTATFSKRMFSLWVKSVTGSGTFSCSQEQGILIASSFVIRLNDFSFLVL